MWLNLFARAGTDRKGEVRNGRKFVNLWARKLTNLSVSPVKHRCSKWMQCTCRNGVENVVWEGNNSECLHNWLHDTGGGGLLVQVQHVHKGKGMPAGTCEQTFLVFLSPGLDKCIPVAFATQVLGTSTENRVGSRNFAKLSLYQRLQVMSV